MKAMSGKDYSAWVLFLDSATYHKSGITQKKLMQLRVETLVNAPQSPELNCCEQFIRSIKSRVKLSRCEEKQALPEFSLC